MKEQLCAEGAPLLSSSELNFAVVFFAENSKMAAASLPVVDNRIRHDVSPRGVDLCGGIFSQRGHCI